MKIDVITSLPETVDGPLSASITGRARKAGAVEIKFTNPRDFTSDNHRTIDDRPYGGGAGMILKAEPLYLAVKKLKKRGSAVIFTSPRGEIFNQTLAKKLAKKKHLIFVCGHYEGVDARVYPYFDMEVSLGDFILTGGEPAAVVMIDAITRLLPGTFKKPGVAENESFENNLLEAPQYTRPEVWRGKKVPAVLLSGNHKEIEIWKQNEAVKTTKQFRPDLLLSAAGKDKRRKKLL